MRHLQSILATALCSFSVTLAATPAAADWQYTKWGMTPDQVAQASKGAVTAERGPDGYRLDGSDYDFWTLGSYASGKYQFKAAFYFENNRLAMVRLAMPYDIDKCASLNADLEGVYGPPTDQSHSNDIDDAKWLDQKTNNRVDIMRGFLEGFFGRFYFTPGVAGRIGINSWHMH